MLPASSLVCCRDFRLLTHRVQIAIRQLRRGACRLNIRGAGLDAQDAISQESFFALALRCMFSRCWSSSQAVMLLDPMDNCGQTGSPVSFSLDGQGTQMRHRQPECESTDRWHLSGRDSSQPEGTGCSPGGGFLLGATLVPRR